MLPTAFTAAWHEWLWRLAVLVARRSRLLDSRGMGDPSSHFRPPLVAAVLWSLSLLARPTPAMAIPLEWEPIGMPGAEVTNLVAATPGAGSLWATAGWRLYTSTDGGASWQERMSGLPVRHPAAYVREIVPDPSQSGTVLLTTRDEGLWRTTDDGQLWVRVLGPTEIENANRPVRVVADPFAAGTFYLAAGDSLLGSTDHGATWQPIGVLARDNPNEATVALAADPEAPGTIYVARRLAGIASLSRTTDYGTTWTTRNDNLPGGSEGPLRIADDGGPTFYWGGSDLHTSVDGGSSWQAAGLSSTATRDITVDPASPAIVYVVGDGQRVFRTADSGASWQTLDAHVEALGNYDLSELAIDPQNPANLFVGSSAFGVLASTDTGAGWALSNTGMVSELVVCDLAVAETSQTLFAIASATFLRSTDDGDSWIPSSPESGAGDYPEVAAFAVDRADDRNVYVATAAHGIFKSIDGGASWTAASAGLTDLATSTITIDPQDSQILYAGSQDGLFRSTDGAGTWALRNADLNGLSAIDVAPFDASVVFFDDGLLKSSDAGATAEPSPPLADYYADWQGLGTITAALGLDPSTAGTVHVAAWGSISIPGFPPTSHSRFAVFRSDDHLETATVVDSVNSRGFLTVDPNDPSVVYSGLGRSVQRSEDFNDSSQTLVPAINGRPCALAIDSTTGALYAGAYAAELPEAGGVHRLASVDCSVNADCDDLEECTADTCEAGICKATATAGTACTDGCSTGTCSNGACNFLSNGCDDDNACTDDVCGVADVCSHNAMDGCVPCSAVADCDDGDDCTTDQCSAGVCSHAAVVCDDSEPCTEDSCEAGECLFTVDFDLCTEQHVVAFGAKLTIKPRRGSVALRMKMTDSAVPAWPVGSYADPSLWGASVEVFNPDASVTRLDVPSGDGDPGWSARGYGAASRYCYRNRDAPTGPSAARKVRASASKIHVDLRGGVTLPDGSATRVGIRITSGSTSVCALMQTDSPADHKFKAKKAMVIPDCSDASLTP